MLNFKKLFKSKKGTSSVEIIVWFSIAFVLLTIFFVMSSMFSSNENISNTQNNTLVSQESIDKNNADQVLNDIQEKEPITQNIVINNIVKEDNNNFLKDINMNIISDIISTVLIATAGFLIGKFSRKKKVKLSKKEEFKI